MQQFICQDILKRKDSLVSCVTTVTAFEQLMYQLSVKATDYIDINSYDMSLTFCFNSILDPISLKGSYVITGVAYSVLIS